MGSQLAEAESLLQKQDLLETQVSALGETIGIISSTAMKVEKTYSSQCLFLLCRCERPVVSERHCVCLWRLSCALLPSPLSLSQVQVGDVHQIQSKVRALETQYKSLVSLCSSRSSSLITPHIGLSRYYAVTSDTVPIFHP